MTKLTGTVVLVGNTLTSVETSPEPRLVLASLALCDIEPGDRVEMEYYLGNPRGWAIMRTIDEPSTCQPCGGSRHD